MTTKEHLRDPFAASRAARAEHERIAALGNQVESYTVVDPDEDITCLPGELHGLLSADDRHFWVQLEPARRVELLRRAHRRSLQAAERNHQRALRQDTCGHYIDLLCQLINTNRREIGDEAYDELRSRYVRAKEEWESLKQAPRTKTAARTAPAEASPDTHNQETGDADI
jgi:hypothetical protein